MMDVEQEVAYWRATAEKDLQFAGRLIAREDSEEILYSLFFLHLALEKAFKAHVVKRTEARYPNLFMPTPTLEKAKEYLEQTKELMEWLIKQL
ncbi:hypothetical protein FBQ81_12945 [Chloroflexi bacterium CFX6]|nr:hypothetical protein [Chloroflexi bacterium CFX6]